MLEKKGFLEDLEKLEEMESFYEQEDYQKYILCSLGMLDLSLNEMEFLLSQSETILKKENSVDEEQFCKLFFQVENQRKKEKKIL